MRSTTKVKAQKQSNGSREDPPAVVTDQPRHNKGRGAGGGSGEYIQRVTNDEREDEMNENLE